VRWRFGVLAHAVPHLLLAGVLIASGVILKQWAYATTYRLLLDGRVDDSAHSLATQRFDLEDGRVVPKILMGEDHILFRTGIGQASTIRAEVRPSPGAGFDIRLHEGGTERVIAHARASAALGHPGVRARGAT